jgi:hypothetical protein
MLPRHDILIATFPAEGEIKMDKFKLLERGTSAYAKD